MGGGLANISGSLAMSLLMVGLNTYPSAGSPFSIPAMTMMRPMVMRSA